MNTNKWFLTLVLIGSMLFFQSCSEESVDPSLLDDIEDPIDQEIPEVVTGTYVMTSFNTSTPVDLNNDGVFNNNHMNETTCYDNSFLILNNNNTFSATGKSIEIEFDFDFETEELTSTIVCFDEGATTGTWSLSGNNVEFNYTFDGETFSETYTRVGNTLRFSIPSGVVLGGTDNGEPVYLTTNIEVIYTKQ